MRIGLNKKVVGLAIAFMLAISMMSGGAWAFFSDTETSVNNTLTAGTLDLLTNDVNGVTQTLYAANLKPNNSVGPATITLKNSGTLAGATLDIVFSYVESDGAPNAVNMTADITAAIIEVTTLTYNGANLLTGVSDLNANGWKDIQDVKNATNLTGLSGLGAGLSKDFVITIKMRDGINNDFQADGVIITMTFTLKQ